MSVVKGCGVLAGKVALITGGGSGIGRATAMQMVLEGAKICVVDISSEGGQETLRLASKVQPDSEFFFVEADVSKEEDISKAIESTAERFGRIDIMFNNAGIYEWHSVESTPTEVWDKVISVNLRGAFLGTKHATPYLKETHGVIVNTSSSLGFAGSPDSAAYCASKSGIIGLTKAAALDLAKYGIRVNCICPGSIDTKMQEKEFSRSENPRKMREAYEKIYPVKRIGKPEEVAKLVVFLCSEASSFITGSAFLIDGGLFAQWGEALAPLIK